MFEMTRWDEFLLRLFLAAPFIVVFFGAGLLVGWLL